MNRYKGEARQLQNKQADTALFVLDWINLAPAITWL
jgi:hypothetical protein